MVKIYGHQFFDILHFDNVTRMAYISLNLAWCLEVYWIPITDYGLRTLLIANSSSTTWKTYRSIHRQKCSDANSLPSEPKSLKRERRRCVPSSERIRSTPNTRTSSCLTWRTDVLYSIASRPRSLNRDREMCPIISSETLYSKTTDFFLATVIHSSKIL